MVESFPDSAGLPAGRRRLVAQVLALALLVTAVFAVFATSYVYDANGRLVVATNDAGLSVRYVYDRLGNITRVDRLLANDLAVFGFTPGRGAPGVAVRITGQGFSTTPAQNSVQFNGIGASVSGASANELTAIVPAGATTGPLTVTVGARTAVSSSNFIVDQEAQPPSITAVSPLIAAIGSFITVDGQAFMPVVNQTTTRLNQRPVVPSAATNTQIIFPVSAGTGSGKVTVSTPYGSASSAQDVLVVPSSVTVAEVAQIQRLTLDAAAQSFSIPSTGYVAALFEGVRGDLLSAQFTDIGVANVSYSLYGIGNNLLLNGSISVAAPTAHLPKLPASGTYLLMMGPVTGPANWKLSIEKAKSLENNGSSLAVSTGVAGQQKRLTFTATAGQNLGLGLSDLLTPGTTSPAHVEVRRPNGTSLANQSCYAAQGGCQVNLLNLVAGTYSVIISPPSSGNRTMQFTTTLSSEVIGILARNAALSLSLPRRGQNGRLSFAGTAGETVALQVAGQATVPAGQMAYYWVYRPDGTLLTSASATLATTLNLPNLPATGTYQVLVDPEYGETLSGQVTVRNTP
ncbi:MAG TPA: IPT/TIG domain-containing protein [Pseudoxanthomonas sp.]|nr:IPT/TIG domain-containing protein [Pseudoxanthomonas sp.]